MPWNDSRHEDEQRDIWVTWNGQETRENRAQQSTNQPWSNQTDQSWTKHNRNRVRAELSQVKSNGVISELDRAGSDWTNPKMTEPNQIKANQSGSSWAELNYTKSDQFEPIRLSQAESTQVDSSSTCQCNGKRVGLRRRWTAVALVEELVKIDWAEVRGHDKDGGQRRGMASQPKIGSTAAERGVISLEFCLGWWSQTKKGVA